MLSLFTYYIFIFLLLIQLVTALKPTGVTVTFDIPEATANWAELISNRGVKFSARDSHASCVFKNKIWVVGGKTDAYTTFNLQTSYKAADVWWSDNGAEWYQEGNLKGDFWAQNDDAKQPGPVAPWYGRFGHSLDTAFLENTGNSTNQTEVMLMMAGYSPEPSNDLWVTPDGVTWVFCGYAPWSPRAWHATAKFQGSLWLAGGSPLNNEVWMIESVRLVENRRPPLTRSMYVNYTYSFVWKQITAAAPWSPRVGMGLVSHWWFNDTADQTADQSSEYLVLIGGFGGWPSSSPLHDGMHGRNDVWFTTDGYNWTVATKNASFGGRGWMAVAALHGATKQVSALKQAQGRSGEIYLVGGGNIGYSTESTQIITAMDGKMDAYWSRDMVNWVQINYEEGGGRPDEIQRSYSSKNLPQYSSQEWARTVVDSVTVYLGKWGMTLELFNSETGLEYPNASLILIGGTYDGNGARSSNIYKSQPGLFCDRKGVSCNFAGQCNADGCACSPGYLGDHCEIFEATSGAKTYFQPLSITIAILALCSIVLFV